MCVMRVCTPGRPNSNSPASKCYSWRVYRLLSDVGGAAAGAVKQVAADRLPNCRRTKVSQLRHDTAPLAADQAPVCALPPSDPAQPPSMRRSASRRCV